MGKNGDVGKIKIREVTIGEGRPKICVPVMEAEREEILAAAGKAAHSPADIMEWRVDGYGGAGDRRKVQALLLSLRRVIGEMPLLFTFRTKEEGGAGLCSLSLRDYLWLNYCALESGAVDLCDVEMRAGESVMRTLAGTAHSLGRHIVGSYHNFQRTPETQQLCDIFLTMDGWGADILKTAVMPEKDGDMERLRTACQDTLARTDRPLIAISMGKLGEKSRTHAELFGSSVTFGCLEKASAPGQIDVWKLADQLHKLHEERVL